MYVSFAAVAPAVWVGVLDPSGALAAGHVVMLGLMLAVMLTRRYHYTTRHRPAGTAHSGSPG